MAKAAKGGDALQASTKDLLDAASTRKVELETTLLKEQLTPAYQRRETLRLAAGVSGLIIAVVTVIGGLLSVAGWFLQQGRDRELRVQERMDKALSLLSAERASQRSAAVASLQSLLTADQKLRNSQVMVSLASALPLEDDSTVRNAILSFFEDVDATVAGQPALDLTLKSLANNSRGLVLQSDLWRKRPSNLFRIDSDLKDGPALQAVARAMTLLLRKGARSDNLRGIYLGRSDLTGANLVGTSFDGSVLAWSDFSGSLLENASFDGADLENVRFVGSGLRGAKMTYVEPKPWADPKFNYVQMEMNRAQRQVQVSLPDFHCADLREVDFSGHALFGVTRDEWRTEFKLFSSGPSFDGANLAGTNFKNISLYRYYQDNDEPIPFITMNGSEQKASGDDFRKGVYRLAPDAPLGENQSDYQRSFADIRLAFSGANWKAAKLPKAIATLLTQGKVPEQRDARVLINGQAPCAPRAPW